MKKTIIFIVLASVVGIFLSYYYYLKLQEEIDVKIISVFQTGVYSSYDEALVASNNKSNIFFDGKLYHVYDSISASKEAKDKLIKFYDNNNVKYYVKEKYVNLKLYDDLLKYSKLIEISDNDTIKIINKQMIEKYGADILWVI